MTAKKETKPKLILGQLYGARDSFAELAKAKKPAKTSYKIAKWMKSVIAPELELIEKERVSIITSLSKDGEIKAKTPEMLQFIKQFNDYLNLSPDPAIKPCDMTMDELMDALDKGENNFSEQDIFNLEPFFK